MLHNTKFLKRYLYIGFILMSINYHAVYAEPFYGSFQGNIEVNYRCYGSEYRDGNIIAFFNINLIPGELTLKLISNIFTYDGTGTLTQPGNYNPTALELQGTLTSNYKNKGTESAPADNRFYPSNIIVYTIPTAQNSCYGATIVTEPITIQTNLSEDATVDGCEDIFLYINNQITNNNVTSCTRN